MIAFHIKPFLRIMKPMETAADDLVSHQNGVLFFPVHVPHASLTGTWMHMAP
jgi:hypothetical protein